jgi:hypothetical protein
VKLDVVETYVAIEGIRTQAAENTQLVYSIISDTVSVICVCLFLTAPLLLHRTFEVIIILISCILRTRLK